jgi:hypothetical protein
MSVTISPIQRLQKMSSRIPSFSLQSPGTLELFEFRANEDFERR